MVGARFRLAVLRILSSTYNRMASIQSGAGGKSRYQGDDAAAAAAAQSTDSLPGEGDDSRTGHSDQMQSTPQMHSKRGAAGSRKPSDSPPRAHATAGAPRRGASGNERLYEGKRDALAPRVCQQL